MPVAPGSTPLWKCCQYYNAPPQADRFPPHFAPTLRWIDILATNHLNSARQGERPARYCPPRHEEVRCPPGPGILIPFRAPVSARLQTKVGSAEALPPRSFLKD